LEVVEFQSLKLNQIKKEILNVTMELLSKMEKILKFILELRQ